jgi:hypothetical protein
MNAGGSPRAWTIAAATTCVDLNDDDTAVVSFKVTNNDVRPEGRQGTVRVLPSARQLGWWFTVDRDTRTFGAGATEEFRVTITIPADAMPSTFQFVCFVFATNNPSADTVVDSDPITVMVRDPTSWTIVADVGHVDLMAGESAMVSFTVTAPGCSHAAVRMVPIGESVGTDLAWFTVDRPTRTISAGTPERFQVTIQEPHPGAESPTFTSFRGEVFKADDPGAEARALSAAIGFAVQVPESRRSPGEV